MGTAAWVRLDCRTAVRRHTAFAGEGPCPDCGKTSSYLGYGIPVPPKDKQREWATLRDQLSRERMQREVTADAAAVRSRHDLEQEIARLEAMPANAGRAKAIRLLRRQLFGSNAYQSIQAEAASRLAFFRR